MLNHPVARQRWALAALTLPVLLLSVDLTVLSMALPHLSGDLTPTGTQLLWIIDIYGVFLAGLLIPMGSLGDRIGRRRLLLIGGAAFGAASILAAFAPTAEVLIAARALLGIGGATLMPSTLSLIRTIFRRPAPRRRALAVWMAAYAGGAGLGPVIGGLLLEHFWWGSVFLINVPIMALLLILGPLVLPEARDPAPGRFDVPSVLLLITAVLVTVFGFKSGTVVLLLAGAAVAVVFTVRQRRLATPLIDVALFRSLPFTTAVLSNIAGVFALTGVLYFYPQYVQTVLGRTPFEAGLWSIPIAAGAVIGALLAPRIARRLPTGVVIGLGLTAAAVGYLLLSLLGVNAAMILTFVAGALLGAGAGLSDTLTNDVILGTAPVDKAGAAAGISETAYHLGAVMGTAILGTVGARLYASNVLAGLPAGTPADVATTASQTVGAASRLAGPFRAIANDAFVDAMSRTFLTGAAVVGVAGLAAALVLRHHRPAPSADH
ncbi:MFS transporter [Actinoplanes philippinensis]|uniref:MFS transporter, DHA2 family, multidrug resistance protein n=1 Tax=Actinoplanes philippinensis TaxID=35752 RepID=A0A1I2G097_9ACTN|nr:MFS transporter [Actinoplanes philippinensis]GIE76429.1 MFS transporter [Actinoplanes philippinensis]SFF10176.1 MFS transporter, DHA2 family, multidrug resistance protein [Actinoplanes philippinensis]